LKQIEPWVGPFFILKKNTFSWGTTSVSKGLGSNIKMCDWLYERIRLTLEKKNWFKNNNKFKLLFYFFAFLVNSSAISPFRAMRCNISPST
jgi:hypothetical protein